MLIRADLSPADSPTENPPGLPVQGYYPAVYRFALATVCALRVLGLPEPDAP